MVYAWELLRLHSRSKALLSVSSAYLRVASDSEAVGDSPYSE